MLEKNCENVILPIAIGNMSEEELNEELMKGFLSLQEGKGMSAAEVNEALAKEFGI